MSNKKLYFVLRHGERGDRHATTREFPVNFDPTLTEKGLIQAQQSAQKIFSLIPSGKTIHLVSSPTLRCIETAAAIASVFNIPIHIEEGFGALVAGLGSSPFDRLTHNIWGIEEVEKFCGAKIIMNNHLARPTFPEPDDIYQRRIQYVWDTYTEMMQEDVLIIVSHMIVVQSLTSILLNTNYSVSEEGYCRLTVAEETDKGINVLQAADYSHATQ